MDHSIFRGGIVVRYPQLRYRELAGVGRVHFSCDGAISPMDVFPGRFIRVGDTASGTDGDSEECHLWTCVRIETDKGAKWYEWKPTADWTEKGAKACIAACDLVVVVGG